MSVGTVGVWALVLVRPAWAQEAPAEPAPAAIQAKDVVRLKNGGLLRGTISELIPGASVTIVTIGGKTRELPMSEVTYAGPADRDPEASQPTSTPPASAPPASPPPPITSSAVSEGDGKAEPYVAVKGARATLKLESDPPGLTYHRASSSAVAVASGGGSAIAVGYERLCTAPCEVTMPAGTEVFALSRPDERAREAEPVTFPAGASRIHGTIESRAGVRVAGWLIGLGGTVAGAALMLTSREDEERCSDISGCHTTTGLNTTKFLLGVSVMSVGMGVGFYMAFRPDVAKVEVASKQLPLALPPARGFAFGGVL
jgi:hypothetical protein